MSVSPSARPLAVRNHALRRGGHLFLTVLLLLTTWLGAAVPVLAQTARKYVYKGAINPYPFHSPGFLAIDSTGRVYMTDGYDLRIKVFSSDGKFLKWLSVPGGLVSGHLIHITPDDKVLIADFTKCRVLKIDYDGNVLLSFGSKGNGAGQFANQVHSAIQLPNGSFAVTDGQTGIHIFDSAGKFVRTIGASGTGNGQFNVTADITCDPQGNLYIVDYNNNRIQKMKPDGSFVWAVGAPGSNNRQFNTISQIFFGSDGRLHIADVNNNRIQVLNSDGSFYAKFGANGTAIGYFTGGPTGVGMYGGKYFISEKHFRRLQIFSNTGIVEKAWHNQFNSPNKMVVLSQSVFAFWEKATESVVFLENGIRKSSSALSSLVENNGVNRANILFRSFSKYGDKALISTSSTYDYDGNQYGFRRVGFNSIGTRLWDESWREAFTSLRPEYFTNSLTSHYGIVWQNEGPVKLARVDRSNSANNKTVTFEVGSGYLQMKEARAGVALSDGRWVVFDYQLGKYVVLNKDLVPVASYGTPGGFDMQFDRPSDATVAPDDSIYVWDSGNDRFQIVTAEGQHLGSFPLPPQIKQIGDFDIDSKYNLYITDEAEHQIHVLELESDSTAPTTTASASPAANAAGWNKENVSVSLSATDNNGGSGVKEIRYAVNMGTEQVVAGASASFNLSNEGVHTIAYWSVDNKGNVEATKYLTVRIDKTVPTSTGAISPDPNAAGWHKADATLTITGADTGGSDVKEIRWSVDGGSEQTTAGKTATVSLNVSGAHTVSYKAVDNAGHVGASSSASYKLDKVAPVANADIAGSTLTLSATDDESGVKSIQYQIDTQAAKAYTGAVSLPSTAKSVKYWAEDNAGNLSAQKTIAVGLAPKAITLTPSLVYAGATVSVKVELNAAPTGADAVVTLASSNAAVFPLPATVTVPAGSTSATVSVVAGAVAKATSVNLTASLWDRKIGKGVVVRVPFPKTITLAPTLVVGGANSVMTVTLVSKAPAGGQVVNLTSFDTSRATVPASITVAAGATTATATVTTSVTAVDGAVLLGAQSAGSASTAVATLAVRRIGLTTLTLAPTSVVGGNASVGKVTLSRAAPTGGLVVSLSTDDTSVTLPASVTVPAGATSASFTVTTTPVPLERTVPVTAVLGTTEVIAELLVTPAKLATVVLAPNTVIGGASSTGTVTLTGKAPAGGLVVALSSSSAAASVPVTVTIPAGAISATFTVTTTSVSAKTTSTITAALDLDTKTAGLTINP